MKILITGGAGFIGSNLTDRLLNDNEILIIDNFKTGRKENVPVHPNVKLIEGSIGCTAFCSSVFQYFKPDIVIHAAASYKDPHAFHEDAITNVIGTINIINEAKKADVSKIIYFQTALCYGLNPIEQPITFNHPLYGGKYEGGSSYAISKTTAEQYIELSGIPFVSFRLANAYGPRNLSGPLPTFFHRIQNNQPVSINDTRRDFIYIDDLCKVVIKAINGEGGLGYYHVSSGTDYAIRDLFEAVEKALGIKYDKVEYKERTPDDVYTILIDPSRTEKDFNWKITTKLEDGIKDAIEWYKNNEIKETFTHLKLK